MGVIFNSDQLSHEIFEDLNELSLFYNSLSDSTHNYITQGTKAVFNLDAFVFSSISGTLDSIREILLKGRVNDAYTLLRKYFDSTMINIYTNLYLDDHYNIDNFIVNHIDDWRRGKQKLPEYRIISKYIKDSPKLKSITELLNINKNYQEIRNRCNDSTHYNYYYNLLLNDNDVDKKIMTKALDVFKEDLCSVFVQHFSYLFYLNDHYLMSTDYYDYMSAGLTPSEEAQYQVAPYIQHAFDRWVKSNRPDIAETIKSSTLMKLE